MYTHAAHSPSAHYSLQQHVSVSVPRDGSPVSTRFKHVSCIFRCCVQERREGSTYWTTGLVLVAVGTGICIVLRGIVVNTAEEVGTTLIEKACNSAEGVGISLIEKAGESATEVGGTLIDKAGKTVKKVIEKAGDSAQKFGNAAGLAGLVGLAYVGLRR